MAGETVVQAEIPLEEKLPVGAVKDRPGVTVITQENFKEYVDEKLGVVPAKETDEANPDPEAVANEELAKIEAEKTAPKEGDVDGSKVFFKGKWVGKHDFNYRLHLKTEEIRAEEKARVTAAEERAKRLADEKIAAERREAELRAKYEPPKGDLGPEPQPEQFTDLVQYAKAIKEYIAEKTQREITEKQAKEQADKTRAEVAKNFANKTNEFKKLTPDYEERINNSPAVLSKEAMEAVVESEAGPQILYYLGDPAHPERAVELGKLTVGKMLREIGRLEGILGGQGKPVTKSEEKPVTEVSRAPEPISPLKGGNAPVGVLKGSDEVPKNMTYDDWKKLWDAGKIK